MLSGRLAWSWMWSQSDDEPWRGHAGGSSLGSRHLPCFLSLNLPPSLPGARRSNHGAAPENHDALCRRRSPGSGRHRRSVRPAHPPSPCAGLTRSDPIGSSRRAACRPTRSLTRLDPEIGVGVPAGSAVAARGGGRLRALRWGGACREVAVGWRWDREARLCGVDRLNTPRMGRHSCIQPRRRTCMLDGLKPRRGRRMIELRDRNLVPPRLYCDFVHINRKSVL